MKFLRTVEQVAQQDEGRPIYVVAALPEWEHYDPDDCPTPIRAWVQQHCPDVVIEQLSAIELDYEDGDDRDNLGEFLNELTPVFRIGFNAEQAEHFQLAWSSPPLNNLDSPSNFYFLIYDRPEAWQAKGVVGPYVPTADIPSGS